MPSKSKAAKKEPKVSRRVEIDMGEVIGSYVQTCRVVPGALCSLKTFREGAKVHAREHLERHYRWRRTNKWPTGVRVTRRAVCKICNAIRPTAETCGDHFDGKKNVIKASFVCGVVIPDVPPVAIAPAGDVSDDEEKAGDDKARDDETSPKSA